MRHTGSGTAAELVSCDAHRPTNQDLVHTPLR